MSKLIKIETIISYAPDPILFVISTNLLLRHTSNTVLTLILLYELGSVDVDLAEY